MLNFFRKTGFTKSEVILIISLAVIFVTGLLLKEFSWKPAAVFDYSSTDSLFNLKVKRMFGNLEKDTLTSRQKENTEKLTKLNDSLLSISEDKTSGNNKLNFLKTKININIAGTADLVMLPGIGEVTAEKIIDLREKKGKFRNIEQLKEVKGIGDKKFEKIKDYITVE